MTDEPKDWFEASQELGKLMDEANATLDEMAEKCPNELKLAVTKWAMEKIVEHAKSGGSYRYLIYNRMGFGPEAYAPLCDAGLTISNEFDMEQMDKIKEIVRENKYDKLKDTLGLCDEPGCYRDAGCGWPSKNGYRMTCGEHYKQYNKDEW
jgi:hypothetical protein